MALKVKSSIEDQCVTERVGGGWICSRSGWLLELLTELTIKISAQNKLSVSKDFKGSD